MYADTKYNSLCNTKFISEAQKIVPFWTKWTEFESANKKLDSDLFKNRMNLYKFGSFSKQMELQISIFVC